MEVKHNNARLNTEATNEEMEADILNFISKLDSPSVQPDMNYQEAFEYIEATLNYKYVNYDYSKCANTQEFTGELNISVDENNNMSMTDVKAAYDAILQDWHNKYYSVEESVKTPIVFEITNVTEDVVEYTMVVGYGDLDLSQWGDNYAPPPTSIFYKTAAHDMTINMDAQINNDQISRCPTGARLYHVSIGGLNVTDPTYYPSGVDDISLPGNNGYTDYRFFYTSSSVNFHLYLSTTPSFNEYGFYETQFGQFITDYAYNHGGNWVYKADVSWNNLKDLNGNIVFAWLEVNFFFGKEYYTFSAISSL